jgi:prepilin-type N-terminal cleavage/methylation domain-containing protein/prepilin-type processing-associated H-X9-DG protein
MMGRNRLGRGFTIIELIVTMAVIGILIALILPAVQHARESARRTRCVNNLKQIGLALQQYHDTHSVFPIGVFGGATKESGVSEDGYGWGLMLLPFLDRSPLYDLIDPHLPGGAFAAYAGGVAPGGDTLLPVFRCPSSTLGRHSIDSELGKPTDYPGYATSDYKGNNGTDKPAVDGVKNLDGFDGMFFRLRDHVENGLPAINLKEVPDGASSTIAIGESSYFNEGRDQPIWYGSHGEDESVLAKASPDSAPNSMADDDAFFSEHPGGVMFLFADGRAQFIDENISHVTYSRLGSRHDGEPVGEY